ncbi:MAG: hypothetical protein JWM86_518, partial [Thermoleophilia bacterium]|nr:hypothetical protein [Thermoleophilia bacterium]
DPKSDVTRAMRELCVAFSPEATSGVAEVANDIKLSRREKKRLAEESQRAAQRDADLAHGKSAAGEPELELDFADEHVA